MKTSNISLIYQENKKKIVNVDILFFGYFLIHLILYFAMK